MADFKGKKILTFSPYGATIHYGQAIEKELISRGASVISYDERPSQKTLTKIIIRLTRKKLPQIFDLYIKKIIKKNIGENFDYILICRGEAFASKAFKILKGAYPKAKVILYFWDTFGVCDLHANIQYSDRALSFDPIDVSKYKDLIFRPTFSVNEYKALAKYPLKDCSHDLLFVGTVHGDRYSVLKRMRKAFAKQGFSMSEYLYSPSIFVYLKYFIKKFPYISIFQLNFTPISMPDTVRMLKDCKALLDINFTGQTSLSMRAYESMAAQRKYITTNPDVKKYDFYNPNNIAVIDMDTLKIPESFLSTPFVPVPVNILYKYSVKGVVDDLFA